MTRTKLHTLLQLVNGFVKARKHNGMPCNFRKGSGTKGKGKMHKGLGFQPERGEQRKFGGYCNWCWRIGHKEAQCLLKQEYIKSNPSQDPLQRDTRELSNTSEKRAWSQPAQGQKQRERQRQEKTSRKGNHNQDQAGSLNEWIWTAQVWLLWFFNVKELNLSVMSKRMMNLSHRLDPAAYVFCVLKCNSVPVDPTELPSSSKRVSDGNGEPAGTHEKFDQSTVEVLFAVGCRDDRPIVDSGSVVSTCPVDYATLVPIEKVTIQFEFGVCWVNLCNITASSVMFLSPTDVAAAWMSILKSLTRNVQFCLCTKAAAMARWSCSLQMERVKNCQWQEYHWTSETDHGEHSRIRHCVRLGSLRVGRGR